MKQVCVIVGGVRGQILNEGGGGQNGGSINAKQRLESEAVLHKCGGECLSLVITILLSAEGEKREC